jgi:WD40 repeat protein/predicted Ser/Thr protein kinase
MERRVPGALDPDDGGQQLLLGKMLLERGLITPDQLREALVERARTLSEGNAQPSPLGGILVRKGYLSDSQLLGLIAEQQSGDVASPYDAPTSEPPVVSGSAPAVSAPSLPAIVAPDPLQEGGQLGKYRLVRELGRGGMGVVYEAIDSQLNRKVALKLMLSNPNADPKERALEEERFVQEAQLSAKLKHPHIVTVYEAGLLESRQFLAMEMIEGQAFSDWRKNVTMRDQFQVLADVCSAVHHAHEQGILHRDLKPRNILVSGAGHAYVTDFGLAKSLGKNVHQSLTGSGAVVGTPAYMSPEQAQGLDRVDWRTDIYSLGVILYECMTGRTPFTGESPIEILMKVVKDPVIPPLQMVDAGSALGLDKGIENICLKALAKKDRDRYVTAQALSDDLRKWLSGEKIQIAAPRARGKSNKRVYILAGVLLLLLAAGLGYLGFASSKRSVKTELELAAKFMAEENYPEAMIQYRLALAWDPGNEDAVLGAKAAQEGMNRRDREREDRFRTDVINKFREAEEAQLRARELERKQKEADTEEERQQLAEEARKAELEAKKLADAAAKAEESFRRTQTLVVADPGTPIDVWKDAINLMPIVDTRRNAVWGTWEMQDGGRLVSDRSPYARLEIPFQLPQEYDFRMVCERRTGAGSISVILSRGGHQFRCELGGESNTRFAFEAARQPTAVEAPEMRIDPICLRNDVAYTVLIQVRASGAKMFLNGKPVLSWATDYSEIGLNPLWKLRNTLRLGVGSHESETIFHRMELLEITGKGRRQEQQGTPILKAADQVPSQLRPGLVAEYFHGTGFQQLALRRIDASIDYRWKEASPWSGGPTDAFSIRWTGYLHTPRTMRYYFSATADDGVRIWIGDQQMLASWTGRTESPRTFDCTLTEGYHRITVEYYELAYLAYIVLGWSTSPTQPPIPITVKNLFHSAVDDQPVLSSRLPQLLGVLPGSTQNVTSVAIHPGGRLLAVAGEDRRVRLFEPVTQRDLGVSAVHPAGVLCVTFSPDGTQFATGSRGDNRVRVWDSQHRTEIRSFEGSTASVQCVAYSPNGKQLAAGSYDRTIRVWTIESPDDPIVLTGHLGGVEAVAFTPDGKRLVSASLDHTIRLWDVEKGKQLYLVEAHADHVSSLAFMPGGRTLASGGWDGLVKLWEVDPESDPPIRELKALSTGGIEVVCLSFSRDGERLAAGCNDGVIRIWDPAEGREIKTLPGHTARVSSLAFMPSGRNIVSGSADTTVRFWNPER